MPASLKSASHRKVSCPLLQATYWVMVVAIATWVAGSTVGSAAAVGGRTPDDAGGAATSRLTSSAVRGGTVQVLGYAETLNARCPPLGGTPVAPAGSRALPVLT